MRPSSAIKNIEAAKLQGNNNLPQNLHCRHDRAKMSASLLSSGHGIGQTPDGKGAREVMEGTSDGESDGREIFLPPDWAAIKALR
jgi:hypothetical protein